MCFKKRWQNVTFWVGIVVVLLVSLVMIFNKPIANALIQNQSGQITRPTNKGNYDFKHVTPITSAQVARARMQHHNYIGVVAMPQLNMSVPIVEGVSNSDLAVGAGTLKPNQKMGQGNYALAGHNMDTSAPVLFSPLYNGAKVGQLVYLSDLHKVYTYKVTQVGQINAHDVGVINNTKDPIVTLITCNYTGSARILVQGKLIHRQSYKSTPVEIRNILTRNVHQ